MSATTTSTLDVLIIDDDDLMRERLEALLDANGIGALGVGTLAQAREAVKAIHFPVLILDRSLADGDGLELCREYRDADPEGSAAVLMLSSSNTQQHIDAAMAAGADVYLSKSCSDGELITSVKKLLRLRRSTPMAEPARLESLQQYAVMDTLPEQAYDDIARLASYICKTPVALISLVDEKRQWFKARVGLQETETSREYAFCAHAMRRPDEVMVVPDATRDSRFVDNPLVTREQGIRFYAGAPLVTPEGFSLGTVCVIDNKPRELDDDGRNALLALSRQVILLLEQRKANIEAAWVDHVPEMIKLVHSLSRERCATPHPSPCLVCSARALVAKAGLPLCD
jgi:DNA-binding response OmpR family regulator